MVARVVEFTTAGAHTWSVPSGVVGDISVTLRGGDGGGGGGGGGGGSGSGQGGVGSGAGVGGGSGRGRAGAHGTAGSDGGDTTLTVGSDTHTADGGDGGGAGGRGLGSAYSSPGADGANPSDSGDGNGGDGGAGGAGGARHGRGAFAIPDAGDGGDGGDGASGGTQTATLSGLAAGTTLSFSVGAAGAGGAGGAGGAAGSRSGVSGNPGAAGTAGAAGPSAGSARITYDDGTTAPVFSDSTGDPISGNVGTSISSVIVPAATGNPAPTYAAVGSLPDGIVFNSVEGTITGTPTEAGTGTITIRATNSAGTADWTVNYNFVAALSAPMFAVDTGTPISGVPGQAIAGFFVPAATGNPTPTYEIVGSPPDGLAFSPSTRLIFGTPTREGSGTIRIRATNSQGTDDWTVAYEFRNPRQDVDWNFTGQVTGSALQFDYSFLEQLETLQTDWNLSGQVSGQFDFQVEYVRKLLTHELDWDFAGAAYGALDFQARLFVELPAPALQPSSDQLRESAFAHETAEAWLVLLTISHDDLTEPIRVVNNEVDIVSRGNTFVAYAFEPILPTDAPDRAPEARLRLDNVSRELIEHIRSIQSPPSVTFEVIRSTAPDVVEKSWTGFELRDVRWDAREINGRLAQRDILTEAYPADIFSPAQFRGLV